MLQAISLVPLIASAASGSGCLGEDSKVFKAGTDFAETQSPPAEQRCF